jgi:acetyl-CoA synthetase
MNFKNYWLTQSKLIKWSKKPKISLKQKKNNYFTWFPDGKLNVYSNCVQQHLNNKTKNKIAIYFINKDKKISSLTYGELDSKVNKFCSFLIQLIKKRKIKKVMIHASSSEWSAISMLSCAKLGIHFSIIFEDLGKEAIEKRIKIFKPEIIFSISKNKDLINFFSIVSKKNKFKIVYFYKIKLNKTRFITEIRNTASGDNFFSIFTSGSTGNPKGITHSYGGFLLYVVYTCKHQFGMNKNSIVLTASDAGWINGHNYQLFGPLAIGATTILMERPVALLDETFLKTLFKLKISILYLPVTLIRLMKKIFKDNHRYKSIITLGSMGEPLAPSVGEWFSKCFSNGKRAIVNTYYQTETGAIICSPKFNETSKFSPHGSAGKPINKYIKLSKLHTSEKREIKVSNLWPGCMTSVLNGFSEWKKYWDKQNNFRLFDLGTIKNNNVLVHGRLDDVINIRGHRIGSEEVESVVLKIKEVVECSAISIPDDLEGHVLYLFVVGKSKDLDEEINNKIKSIFGIYALPKSIYYLSELPKTRSGKILRRLLRYILLNTESNEYGDLSTILNSEIVKEIQYVVRDHE